MSENQHPVSAILCAMRMAHCNTEWTVQSLHQIVSPQADKLAETKGLNEMDAMHAK